MRLTICGAALILLELARWNGLGAGNIAFGPGVLRYPLMAMCLVLPLVAGLVVLQRPTGRVGTLAVVVGAFLILNDIRFGLEVWSGWAILLCGAIAVVEGVRQRRRLPNE